MADNASLATATCRCGHVQEAHEHFRRGSDCGVCGRDVCAAFTLAPAQPAPAPEPATHPESNSA